MQLFNYIATALTLALLPVIASANDHLQGRTHHQAIARRAEGHLDRRLTANSRWSWYETETGQAGSCGRHLKNSEFIVAMNVPQYRAENCFKSITLSWRGKTTRAQIVDMCPGCGYGGLDLSPSLFSFFTPLGTGLLHDGSWWFDGEGPEQAKPITTKARPSPSTSRWTPPPTPTSTRRSSSRSSTRSSTTPSPTPTPSSSSVSSSATSSSVEPSPSPARLAGTSSGNVGSLFQAIVSLGNIAIAGHAAVPPAPAAPQ